MPMRPSTCRLGNHLSRSSLAASFTAPRRWVANIPSPSTTKTTRAKAALTFVRIERDFRYCMVHPSRLRGPWPDRSKNLTEKRLGALVPRRTEDLLGRPVLQNHALVG